MLFLEHWHLIWREKNNWKSRVLVWSKLSRFSSMSAIIDGLITGCLHISDGYHIGHSGGYIGYTEYTDYWVCWLYTECIVFNCSIHLPPHLNRPQALFDSYLCSSYWQRGQILWSNQIELSMKILLSISRPRALYLVDLVRATKDGFCKGGVRPPGGSAVAQLGRNLWWIVSRAEQRVVHRDVWKWSGYSLMQNMGKSRS